MGEKRKEKKLRSLKRVYIGEKSNQNDLFPLNPRQDIYKQ